MEKFQVDPLMVEMELSGMLPEERIPFLRKLSADVGPNGHMSIPKDSLERIFKQYGYSEESPTVSLSELMRGQSARNKMGTENPYPDMSSTYDSTAASMKKVQEAAGGVARKAGKKTAKKVAEAATGEVAKKTAGRIGGLLGGVPGWAAGTIGAGLLFELVPYLLHGSVEDQMRNQMEIQKKLEMEQMGGRGGMESPVSGGYAPPEPSMYEMERGLKNSQDMLQMGVLGGNVNRNIRRSYRTPELEGLIAQDMDRISGIGGRRELTPYELQNILNG